MWSTLDLYIAFKNHAAHLSTKLDLGLCSVPNQGRSLAAGRSADRYKPSYLGVGALEVAGSRDTAPLLQFVLGSQSE